jgi:hypothetical protein
MRAFHPSQRRTLPPTVHSAKALPGGTRSASEALNRGGEFGEEALKETATTLYSYIYERPARKHFRWWHSWAVRSRLQPICSDQNLRRRIVCPRS